MRRTGRIAIGALAAAGLAGAGVPRVSPNGRFGLAVATSGAWESDGTFVLDYNEVGNINAYRFRLTFVDDGVTAGFVEKSRAAREARFRGRSR